MGETEPLTSILLDSMGTIFESEYASVVPGEVASAFRYLLAEVKSQRALLKLIATARRGDNDGAEWEGMDKLPREIEKMWETIRERGEGLTLTEQARDWRNR